MTPPRLAVMISGGGTTLVNLAERIADGRLAAEIAVVISSNPDADGIAHAHELDLPVETVKYERTRREAFSRHITDVVRESAADLVCLAGFLRLWDFPAAYRNKVMNIHPGLLPAFGGTGMYGMRVHEAVIERGVKVTGCTVHFATSAAYDTGPIVLQKTVPVRFDDSPTDVQRRVFAAECEAYPEAIELFATERLRIADGRVQILGARTG